MILFFSMEGINNYFICNCCGKYFQFNSDTEILRYIPDSFEISKFEDLLKIIKQNSENDYNLFIDNFLKKDDKYILKENIEFKILEKILKLLINNDFINIFCSDICKEKFFRCSYCGNYYSIKEIIIENNLKICKECKNGNIRSI